MKSKYLILSVLVAGVLTVGCTGKKEEPKKASFGIQPEMTVSALDTTTVVQMTTDFLEQVKQGNIEDAVSRLYVYENEQVRQLNEQERQDCSFLYSMFPVYDFKVDSFRFIKETDTNVHFHLIIEDPATTASPRTRNGLIRPVRINGVWYLTLANSAHEHQHSEAGHQH